MLYFKVVAMAHDEDELVDQSMVKALFFVHPAFSEVSLRRYLKRTSSRALACLAIWVWFKHGQTLSAGKGQKSILRGNYLKTHAKSATCHQAWSSYAKPENFEFVALEDFVDIICFF